VTKVRAPIGSSANDYVTATTDYNGANAVTKSTDPRGYNTTFLYDADRQLTKVTDARGKTWKYYYDLAHQPTMIKDLNDRQYAYYYDATGALVAQADPLSKGVFYYHDKTGEGPYENLLMTRTVYNQGNNGTLKFGYDGMRRVTAVNDGADVLMTSVMYDVAGRVTKQDEGAAWGANRTLNVYTYDSDTGALTKATLGYMIDAASRLSKHTLEYDRIGRPTDHYFGSDSTGNTHRMRWQYSYDDSNAGRITGIASSNDDGLSAGSTAYAYEDHGRLSRVTLRNGAYADYLYDRGGRLTRLANYHSAYNDGQGTTRRLTTSFDYTYDANSNITEIIQDFVGAEVVTDYAYDEINRLTREATCDFMNRYYYDDGGNRTKLVHMNAVYSKDGNGRIVSMLTKASASTQGLTKTYYYSNYTELTKMTASEYGGTTRDYTYEHDNAGRLTRQVQNVFSPNSTTTYNYEWDALDRMTKVQRVASGVTKTINYTYNAAGLRVRRVDTSTNVTKLWTYQGNNIASVQTSSGGSYGAADYVYTVGPGAINNVTERHLHTDMGADSWYYQYDHRGNVVAITDYAGKILRGYQYDAFGNIPFSFATGQSGAAPTDDILFTGKDLDPDTGLYYFNARWYDPEIGTFVARTTLPPNIERAYAFCSGNPMNRVDKNGRVDQPLDLTNLDLGGLLEGNPSSACNLLQNPSSACGYINWSFVWCMEDMPSHGDTDWNCHKCTNNTTGGPPDSICLDLSGWYPIPPGEPPLPGDIGILGCPKAPSHSWTYLGDGVCWEAWKTCFGPYEDGKPITTEDMCPTFHRFPVTEPHHNPAPYFRRCISPTPGKGDWVLY